MIHRGRLSDYNTVASLESTGRISTGSGSEDDMNYFDSNYNDEAIKWP